MAAPIIMGILGKTQKQNGLDASSLYQIYWDRRATRLKA